MEIIVRENGRRVLEIRGRLDLQVAPELQEQLTSALESIDRHLVVDLLNVEFIDSAALGVLVGIHRNAEKMDGGLILIAPEGPANQIFSLTKTDEFFDMHSSVEEALRSS